MQNRQNAVTMSLNVQCKGQLFGHEPVNFTCSYGSQTSCDHDTMLFSNSVQLCRFYWTL